MAEQEAAESSEPWQGQVVLPTHLRRQRVEEPAFDVVVSVCTSAGPTITPRCILQTPTAFKCTSTAISARQCRFKALTARIQTLTAISACATGLHAPKKRRGEKGWSGPPPSDSFTSERVLFRVIAMRPGLVSRSISSNAQPPRTKSSDAMQLRLFECICGFEVVLESTSDYACVQRDPSPQRTPQRRL